MYTEHVQNIETVRKLNDIYVDVQSRCKTRRNCPSPAGMRSLWALLLPLSTGVRLFEVPVGIYGA